MMSINFIEREDVVIFKLGQIESKLDKLSETMILHSADDKKVEERVRILESSTARTAGIATTFAAIITIIFNLLVKLVPFHVS